MGKKKGDQLEVRVYDNYYNLFFKRKVDCRDKRQLATLANDLRQFGIDFSKREEDEGGWW